VKFTLGEYKQKQLASLVSIFFLSDSFLPDSELFYGLASKNSLLLASMASVCKNFFTPLHQVK
jgi:hypothetical protein